MSECTAPTCFQPTTDAFLCGPCTDRAARQLRDLAGHPARRGLLAPPLDRDTPEQDRGLLADLMVTMSRQDVVDPDTARPAELDDDPPRSASDQPIAAHPLPMHVGAARALSAAHGDLRGWVAALVERRHGRALDGFARDVLYRQRTARPRVPGALGRVCGPWRAGPHGLPDGEDPRELAAWLGRHPADLRQHPRAGEIAAGVARHAAAAVRVVAPAPLTFLGCCEHCRGRTDGTAAFVDLYAEVGAAAVRCPRCAESWDVRERRQWLLERAADEWLPAIDMSRALVDWVRDVRTSMAVSPRELTDAAVRGMAARGRIARRDPTDAELAAGTVTVPRYQVGEVMALVVTLAGEDRERDARRGGRTAAPAGAA